MEIRMLSRLGLIALSLAMPASLAAEEQEGPTPTGEAVRADIYESTAVDSYYSTKLEASFIAEWMYIKQNGQRITFWGARIVDIDNSSPLHDLGLNVGDVITRLDGIQISRNLHKDHPSDDHYQIPELDRHYGRTQVRYIFTGTSVVRNGHVMLSGGVTPDPTPVQP